jgi:nucleotide-binding universal stress UspA family protein
MRINKVSRNKIEIEEGGRKVVVEVSRLSKHYILTITDGENTADLTVKNIESAKVISVLRRFGVSDVHRVVSYLNSMATVKRIEAPRAIFMRVEDVLYMPEHGGEPQKIGETIETYFHTSEGDWRVFAKNYDVATQTEQYELREAFNIIAPIKNISRLFVHYNTADVDASVAHELCRTAAEVKEVLKQYVVLEEKYYDVVTSWIVATYLRWASPYSELLIIRKLGFGSGGSTLLKTVRLLSARPLRLVVNTSPAAFYRVVDFAMPTIALDEIREDEIQKERLAELKLLAESAFDAENVVLRVEEGEVETFSPYANVVVVDTTDKFTSYSAERRAWTAVIRQAHPPRFYDADEILKSTEGLRERLYALGVALPSIYLPQWRTLAKEQGLGVLRFLERASRALCGDAEIFESALKTVEQQLEYAKQTSLLTDPKRMVIETLQKIIEDAKKELENAASSPNNASEYISIVTPEDPEYRCGSIYLQKLVRELRRRFMEVVQVDARKLDSIHFTTSEVRYWFRVNEDAEMYLKPAKVKALLAEIGIVLETDHSRNYYIRVCR